MDLTYEDIKHKINSLWMKEIDAVSKPKESKNRFFGRSKKKEKVHNEYAAAARKDMVNSMLFINEQQAKIEESHKRAEEILYILNNKEINSSNLEEIEHHVKKIISLK